MSGFKFKQFTIHQDKTAMKIGTDSILFGSWLETNSSCKSILDIGTGTGLLALMMAQKNTNASITALEIDEDAFFQAQENIANSKWTNRIDLIHTNANLWCSDRKYDLLLSNPPYFENALLAENSARTKARHQVDFKIENLLSLWEKFGSENSELACILPIDESEKLIAIIHKKGYFLKEYTTVKPKLGAIPNRAMMMFVKEKTPTNKSELCIRKKDGSYSEEYVRLTKDFYLGL
jgi:tRNA1Val (adenine37-N6)-methyltransferase